MTKILFVLALLLPGAAAAQSTFTTQPTFPGRPELGTTTRLPGGEQLQTRPAFPGRPELGTVTTGPGVNCRTENSFYGKPELGQITRCQ